LRVLFPKWMNVLPTLFALGGVGGLGFVTWGTWYWAHNDFWHVGYQPVQPGQGFNHQIHAGKLGMDCRYCHTKVEKSYEANIPNVATCYGCHAENRLAAWQSHRVQNIREAYAKDQSVEWVRVHKLPDHVHNFPHHVHVAAGISCYSCHGQIQSMPIVYQAHGMGMGWCLDCHRNPDKHIVPTDKVTDLAWVEKHLKERSEGKNDPAVNVQTLLATLRDNPPQNCGACHY
jgi:hypothetical protein